jgi:hypothetical protein
MRRINDITYGYRSLRVLYEEEAEETKRISEALKVT